MSYHRVAVKALFFISGFVHANLAARFPRVQEMFSIDNGTFGFVLLASSAGALLAMPFTGWLIVQNGSRRIASASAFLYCLFVPLIPVVPGLFNLIIVFFIMGVATGMLDVSMNAQAVMVERHHANPIMTSFHALFSIGMVAGAGCGALFEKIQTTLLTHLAVIVSFSVLTALWARYYLIYDKPEKRITEGPAFRLPNAAMVSIGVIAFCCMLGEGAMADWSTNYMENVAHASTTMAPLALSSFALAMTVGRLFGDSVRARMGDRKLLIVLGLISSAGMCISLFFIEPQAVIAGLFVTGLGLSAIVPIAYSIAGNAKGLPSGVGLAMVTTVGYAGFLFGPPVIGFLADWQSLRIALGLVGILFVVMTLLSVRYKA